MVYGEILTTMPIRLLQKFLEHVLMDQNLLELCQVVFLKRMFLTDVDYLLRLLAQEKMETG